MYKKESVYDVIQSLSNEEVSNFYRANKVKSGSDKNYVVLFEIIREQKIIDEESVLKIFNKKTGVKNFSKTKEYLLELILESLDKNKTLKNGYNNILKNLYLADVFFKKGVFHVSEELLSKSIHLIRESEYYDLIDRVYHLRSRLYKKISMKPELALKYLAEYENWSRQMDNTRSYRILEVQFYFLSRTIEDDLSSLDKIIRNPLLQSEKNAQTLSSKIIFHNIYRTYYLLKKNYHAVFEHAEAIVQLYEKNPAFKKHHPAHFLRSLANMGDASLLINKTKVFAEISNKFELAEKQLPTVPAAVTLFKYHAKFLILRQKANYKEGLAVISEYQQTVHKKGIKIHEKLELMHLLHFIIFTFANNDFTRMSKYLNRLGELVKKVEFRSYFLLHKIMELIKYYEQREFYLCESNIRSIRRYLDIYPAEEEEKLIVDTISGSLAILSNATPDIERKRALFKKLYHDLNRIKKYSEMEDFPFRNWAKANSMGITLLDIKNHQPVS